MASASAKLWVSSPFRFLKDWEAFFSSLLCPPHKTLCIQKILSMSHYGNIAWWLCTPSSVYMEIEITLALKCSTANLGSVAVSQEDISWLL